jgi:hypothetical protein
MSDKIVTTQDKPKWGDNYNIGYVGFTHTDGSFVSNGITYFTRWGRMSDIKVSHAFIVTGEDSCVSAEPKGVMTIPLQPYFNNLKKQVFFRKPRGYTESLGVAIAESAETQIGRKYGYGLIVYNAGINSIFGRLINTLTLGGTEKALRWVFDRKSQSICSESAAEALQQQKELKGLGVLKLAAARITPQMLFEDDGCFEPWKK